MALAQLATIVISFCKKKEIKKIKINFNFGDAKTHTRYLHHVITAVNHSILLVTETDC
jgi:hypothetical protein